MSTSPSQSIQNDDFKRIRGIGPGIESRLYSAHIHTYAQLAALTPHELAQELQGLAGITTKRIVEQDWIGQARQLAAEQADGSTEQVEERAEQVEVRAELPTILAVPDEDLVSENMAPESRKHYDNFTVELWLDEDNTVSRTRVLHVQEHNESAWNGWEGQRLINFIEEHAGLHSIEPNEIPALVAVGEPAAIEQVSDRPALGSVTQGSQFIVKKMEVFTANNPSPGHILTSGKPFQLLLALDLSQVEAPPGTKLGYSAKVFAKDLSKGTHLEVAAGQGELMLAEQVNIEIGGNPLPVGPFRLEAAVTLSLHHGTAPLTQQMAFLDGGLFQVY